MPLTHTTSRTARRWATVAVATVASLLLWTVPADAARQTHSASIAEAADRALVALERWESTRNPVDYVRYVRGRDATAELTGSDLGLDAEGIRSAWADAPVAKQHTVLAAISQLGVPWRYATSEPGVAFDCSGLTLWAFGQAGTSLPRVSGDQIDAADSTDRPDAEPGDLVYWPGHIGIYIGADSYVHSPNSGNVVEVARLPDRSLTFGDAVAAADESPAQPTALDAATSALDSLVDRAASITE